MKNYKLEITLEEADYIWFALGNLLYDDDTDINKNKVSPMKYYGDIANIRKKVLHHNLDKAGK